MKNIRKDDKGILGLTKPWNIIGSAIILICGASIWLHNGDAMQDGLMGDLYNLSPLLFGVGVTIFVSGFNIGFKGDWRWMVLMLIGSALFWYAVPMGNVF